MTSHKHSDKKATTPNVIYRTLIDTSPYSTDADEEAKIKEGLAGIGINVLGYTYFSPEGNHEEFLYTDKPMNTAGEQIIADIIPEGYLRQLLYETEAPLDEDDEVQSDDYSRENVVRNERDENGNLRAMTTSDLREAFGITEEDWNKLDNGLTTEED